MQEKKFKSARPFKSKSSGPRSSDSKPSSYSKSNNSDRPSGYSRSNNSDRPSSSDRPSYSDRPSGYNRSNNNDRPSYSDRPSSYSRPNNNDRRNANGETPTGYNRPNKPSSRFGGNGGGRPTGGGSSRRRSSGGGSRRNDQKLEVSRFIRKAVVKETTQEFVPKHTFTDFKISEKLKVNIASRKFVNPTPIQDQAIPHILEGKDFLGIANTGTGKTAAFLIPLIEKVLQNKNERVIIMAPTRELALQIEEEFRAFTRGLNLYSVSCIGGSNIRNQIIHLKRNPSFVIGTPGRLKDLVNRRCLVLSGFTNVVLDEVDRMLDMGFRDDIKLLISMLQEKRQSLFFSATISKEVDILIKGYLNNPVKVSVKSGDTADNIDQDVIKVTDRSKKLEVLHDLLIKDEFKKVLIFGRTKYGVEDLSEALQQRGFKSGSIHGNKSQANRERTLRLFKTNQIQSLVATDVAARGLDIADVTHVINYDLPATYEDYVHRIGRTGRANKTGKALTFV